jgi:hypothetical protein
MAAVRKLSLGFGSIMNINEGSVMLNVVRIDHKRNQNITCEKYLKISIYKHHESDCLRGCIRL